MLVRSVKLDGPATFMMSSVISNPENRNKPPEFYSAIRLFLRLTYLLYLRS
jgi:hypothetical protein